MTLNLHPYGHVLSGQDGCDSSQFAPPQSGETFLLMMPHHGTMTWIQQVGEPSSELQVSRQYTPLSGSVGQFFEKEEGEVDVLASVLGKPLQLQEGFAVETSQGPHRSTPNSELVV